MLLYVDILLSFVVYIQLRVFVYEIVQKMIDTMTSELTQKLTAFKLLY